MHISTSLITSSVYSAIGLSSDSTKMTTAVCCSRFRLSIFWIYITAQWTNELWKKWMNKRKKNRLLFYLFLIAAKWDDLRSWIASLTCAGVLIFKKNDHIIMQINDLMDIGQSSFGRWQSQFLCTCIADKCLSIRLGPIFSSICRLKNILTEIHLRAIWLTGGGESTW